MSLHKLTAGDGYTYLSRQVAAYDATDRGHVGLGDYYSQRGESPGRWAGAGLVGLAGVVAGQPVGEEQMKALFGEGRHPDAARLEREAEGAGQTARQARAAGALGRPFSVFITRQDGFRARCARAFAAEAAAQCLPPGTPLPLGERAWIGVLVRDGTPRAISGEVVLVPGDRVHVYCQPEDMAALERVFTGPRM